MAQKSKSRKLDQYIVRFPEGMRDALKAEAEQNGRSLNAEIVARLEYTFEEVLNALGIQALATRMQATTEALESVFYNIREFDLEQFMADQAKAGNKMHFRAEAVDFIMRDYLSSKGYAIKRSPPFDK
ncbi:hypothetical protein NB311A_05108 [Nitrobacter sp. Nb-311A]|uniref:Arc family DNA-binding protein n=1 Tax=Nitrobacter sp. Nb-311A TaxID=314253 RepID=UPI000068708A|nr:Arc family DNA-binding protein [Nitrobacter sp. Nb-311A]EAQ35768.1 hypothetical protein NB311A_05108 [Nitrobacter sp. Nb-311A]